MSAQDSDAGLASCHLLYDIGADHWPTILGLVTSDERPPRWARTNFIMSETERIDLLCSGTLRHAIAVREHTVVGYLTAYGSDERNQFCHVTYAFTDAVPTSDQRALVEDFALHVRSVTPVAKLYFEIWPEQSDGCSSPEKFTASQEGTFRDFVYRNGSLSDVRITTWRPK